MIHVSQQSAHNGCQGDLGQLSLGAKALVESAQYRVATGRAQGGHVQGQAHFGAAPADTAHSLHRAAFPGPGRQAGQGGHFVAVQSPQFGHMARTIQAVRGPTPWISSKQLTRCCSTPSCCEQGFNLLFHRLDLGLEMGHQLGMLPADKGILMMLGLGLGQSPPVDQLLQPLGQCHQLALGGRSGGRRLQADSAGHNRSTPARRSDRFLPVGLGPGPRRALGPDWSPRPGSALDAGP